MHGEQNTVACIEMHMRIFVNKCVCVCVCNCMGSLLRDARVSDYTVAITKHPICLFPSAVAIFLCTGLIAINAK